MSTCISQLLFGQLPTCHQISNFLTLCPGGGAFDSFSVPSGGFLYTMIVLGAGFLLPSSRVPGVVRGDGFG